MKILGLLLFSLMTFTAHSQETSDREQFKIPEDEQIVLSLFSDVKIYELSHLCYKSNRMRIQTIDALNIIKNEIQFKQARLCFDLGEISFIIKKIKDYRESLNPLLSIIETTESNGDESYLQLSLQERINQTLSDVNIGIIRNYCLKENPYTEKDQIELQNALLKMMDLAVILQEELEIKRKLN